MLDLRIDLDDDEAVLFHTTDFCCDADEHSCTFYDRLVEADTGVEAIDWTYWDAIFFKCETTSQADAFEKFFLGCLSEFKEHGKL